jgi:hypothetical protein
MLKMWGSSEIPPYESLSVPNDNIARTSCGARLLRYGAFAGVALVFFTLAADRVIDSLLEGTDARQDQASTPGVVDLFKQKSSERPYPNEASCPAGGGVCICTRNFSVAGKDSFGYNIIKRNASESACQAWHFEIGDIIFLEKPAGHQEKYKEANMVAHFTGTPVVHDAIVIEVPPKGVEQTGENVIAMEALKGSWKKVLQNNIRTLVERYPFGGVSIRRVDPKRYPDFFTQDSRERIAAWAKQVTGERFDSDMVNPVRKRFFTKGRFISPNPWCHDRERADRMYLAGGPHKWICTQLVAWTIAFAGKLNLNPANMESGCEVPEWVVTNLQPGPGDFLTAKFVQPGSWRVPCAEVGCYLGVPHDSKWAGGTEAPKDARTTTTSVKPTANSRTQMDATTAPTSNAHEALRGTHGSSKHGNQEAASASAHSRKAKKEEDHESDSQVPARKKTDEVSAAASVPKKKKEEEEEKRKGVHARNS